MPQATTPAERSKIIRALVAELKLVYDKLAEATDADADANEPSEPQHVAPGPAAADSAPQRAPSIAVQAVRLRNALLLVAEEHLLHTPQHALTDQADEALWRAVFYSRIQLLRKSIHLSANTPKADALRSECAVLLDSATAFYRSLILELECRREVGLAGGGGGGGGSARLDPTSESGPGERLSLTEARQLLVHKSLLFLGDIDRYRFSILGRSQTAWKRSRMYYEKAMRIRPIGSKAHSQIALLLVHNHRYFESIYYYFLSYGVVLRSSIAQDNISNAFLQASNRLLGPTSMTIEDFAATDAAIGEIIDSISDPDAQVADALSKLSTIFMILSSDLDERFRASAGAVDASDASERRQLRFAQTVSTAGLLLLVSWSLRCLLEQIQVASFFDDVGVKGSLCAGHLAHAGLVCAFLSRNKAQIRAMQRYAKQLEIPAISERVEAFAVVLAAFANEISSFADMDGSRERVPEDAELIGLSCMRGFYEGTEQAARQQSDADASAEFGLLSCDERGVFVATDQQTRRIKTMRALGLERLKDQVLSLQLGSKRLADKPRRASYPVFVLDTMSLVNGIGTIKACLMRSTCIIAVALDAISQLDMLKEGNDTTNKRARDCIRYLEQHLKFRSLFLVSQQIKETQAFASTTMATTTTTTAMTTTTMMMMGLTDGRGLMSAVPATHRGILAYCLYLQSSVRQMPAGAVQSVSFVSDNTESVDAAIGLGVRCISLAEWKRTALAPAAMKRF
ncbi:hypothetical protein HK105_204924 [Polyrhizophydium stewartii]|uniref:Uncharacterized protein n=1 Tax=Polyrhizophydium stewartii TaxID=2732419 RepID=A0ABR4N7L4_9FUNG